VFRTHRLTGLTICLLLGLPVTVADAESLQTQTAVASKIVAGYASVWHVSEAIAQQRLEVQGRGAKLAEQASRALGQHFGGVWFDNETGTFHIQLTPGGEASAAHRVAAEDGISEDTVYQDVPWSLEQPEATDASVLDDLQALVTDREATVGIDTAANAVEVYLSASAGPSGSEYADLLATAAAGEISLVSKPPDQFRAAAALCEIHYDGYNESDNTFCSRPLRVAAGMDDNGDGTTCTVNGVAVATYRYVVTAGHCVKGRLGYTWSTVDASNQSRHNIGEASKDVYGSSGDFGLIKETNSYWEEGYEMFANIEDLTEAYPVYEVASSFVGMFECVAGAQSTIHEHLGCGTVQRVDVGDGLTGHMVETYGPPEPPESHGDTKSMCIYEGDSGGAFLSYYDLIGVLSAGYICGSAENPDIAFYTDAGWIESYYGVAFLTQL
jgi:hypothetical protein